jgi:hypothetical protein
MIQGSSELLHVLSFVVVHVNHISSSKIRLRILNQVISLLLRSQSIDTKDRRSDRQGLELYLHPIVGEALDLLSEAYSYRRPLKLSSLKQEDWTNFDSSIPAFSVMYVHPLRAEVSPALLVWLTRLNLEPFLYSTEHLLQLGNCASTFGVLRKRYFVRLLIAKGILPSGYCAVLPEQDVKAILRLVA